MHYVVGSGDPRNSSASPCAIQRRGGELTDVALIDRRLCAPLEPSSSRTNGNCASLVAISIRRSSRWRSPRETRKPIASRNVISDCAAIEPVPPALDNTVSLRQTCFCGFTVFEQGNQTPMTRRRDGERYSCAHTHHSHAGKQKEIPIGLLQARTTSRTPAKPVQPYYDRHSRQAAASPCNLPCADSAMKAGAVADGRPKHLWAIEPVGELGSSSAVPSNPNSRLGRERSPIRHFV